MTKKTTEQIINRLTDILNASPGYSTIGRRLKTCTAQVIDGTLIIHVPRGLDRDWLEDRATKIIERQLIGITGSEMRVTFVERA